jgi:hypothetical protein
MTSIEWLIDQMFRQGYFDGNKPLSFTNLDHLQHQAKEMHKQEIINAWNSGDYAYFYSKETGRDFADGSEYYQETFVSKGSDDVELPKHPSVISENGNKLLFDKEGNLIKELPKQETLYTEEQVREAYWIGVNRGNGVDVISINNFLQSLKQPKKD